METIAKPNQHMRIFTPNSIGWVMVILGLINAGLGIGAGFALMAINWHRLKEKKTAAQYLGLGIVTFVLLTIMKYLWETSNYLAVDRTMLIISFAIRGILLLLTIALLEKYFRKELGRAIEDVDIESASSLEVATKSTLIVVAAKLLMVMTAYAAWLIIYIIIQSTS